jgi:GTP-binding protein EngB required for normal cell division
MNDHHRRAIAVTFRHIDGRLAEIEAILGEIGSQSPFSAYVLDIGPLARRSALGYLQRLRERMWSALKELRISQDGRQTSAAWAIRGAMIGVTINIADLEPQRLVGYGDLQPEMAKMLSGICADLRRLSESFLAYLARAQGEDLGQRLGRLTEALQGDAALAKVDDIITRYGLVELRPILENIVARLESPDLEVAFFGRVNSGKSSLFNYLLGTDILPVGVLPVTAVLTRLRRAEQAEIVVQFEISEPQRLPLDRIGEFVTEEGNPRNERRVSEVELRLPNPRLADGVVFIDTPGVGSLATFGASQTKDYLPRCDVAILLVDGGSPLNDEDLALLHGFFEAAIPVTILISKCDLLNEANQDRVIEYVREIVSEEFGGPIPVYPVSSRSSHAARTEQWFTEAIQPQIARHREIAEQSIRRKTAHLEELAASYLEAMLRRCDDPASEKPNGNVQLAEALLAEANDRIAALVEMTAKPIDPNLPDVLTRIIHQAAPEAVAPLRKGGPRSGALAAATLLTMAETADEARRRLEDLILALEEILKKISATCGAPYHSALKEAGAGLTPLPRADEKRLKDVPEVRPSRIFSWWPEQARRIVMQRMRRQGGAAILSTISDHQNKVRIWLKDNLDNVCRAYESYAALFRDHLSRAGDVRTSVEGAAQMRADLEFLGGLDPESQENVPLRAQGNGPERDA